MEHDFAHDIDLDDLFNFDQPVDPNIRYGSAVPPPPNSQHALLENPFKQDAGNWLSRSDLGELCPATNAPPALSPHPSAPQHVMHPAAPSKETWLPRYGSGDAIVPLPCPGGSFAAEIAQAFPGGCQAPGDSFKGLHNGCPLPETRSAGSDSLVSSQSGWEQWAPPGQQWPESTTEVNNAALQVPGPQGFPGTRFPASPTVFQGTVVQMPSDSQQDFGHLSAPLQAGQLHASFSAPLCGATASPQQPLSQSSAAPDWLIGFPASPPRHDSQPESTALLQSLAQWQPADREQPSPPLARKPHVYKRRRLPPDPPLESDTPVNSPPRRRRRLDPRGGVQVQLPECEGEGSGPCMDIEAGGLLGEEAWEDKHYRFRRLATLHLLRGATGPPVKRAAGKPSSADITLAALRTEQHRLQVAKEENLRRINQLQYQLAAYED